MKTFFALYCVAACCVALTLPLTGCGDSRQPDTGGAEKFALEFTDSFGRTVRLKDYPRRIVSLAPNMTESLFLLGAGSLLVGRTDYCDYPPEAAKIPSVGTITEPNREYIVNLAPDLVVGSTHFRKETVDDLENLRIPVYLGIIYGDYEEIFGVIKTLGSITGKTPEAQTIVADMRARKAAVETAVQGAAYKPRVYYMISFGEAGDYTAGKDTFIASLIASAGGVNAAQDITGWRYTTEALFRDEPDIILCGRGSGGAGDATPARLKAAPPYNRLKAVREDRVYEIDNNLLDRIGPRNIAGLEMLARILHKELFP